MKYIVVFLLGIFTCLSIITFSKEENRYCTIKISSVNKEPMLVTGECIE